MESPHERLIRHLRENGVPFRTMEHEAEGRSEHVARIRGTKPSQGMKAIVVGLRGGGSGKDKRYVLAVLPGDRKLDMKALRQACQAQKASFVDAETLSELTGGCVAGTVPPFSFNEGMPLIVDNAVRRNTEVCFNAARLDRSVFMTIDAYLALTNPRMADFSLPPEA